MNEPEWRRPWWWKKRWWAAGLLAFLILPPAAVLAFVIWSENAPAIPPSKAARLHVGMTDAAVLAVLGPPRHRYPKADGSKTWVFNSGTLADYYIEFGSDGRVTSHWDAGRRPATGTSP